MIIDFTKDNIYQHQTYIGVGFVLNWSGTTSAVVPVVVRGHQEMPPFWPIPVDEIDFIDADDMITFGG